MDGQLPIATQGRDRTVHPDEEVIHGNVQDRVKGNGPAQALPSTIVPRNASRYLVSYVRNPKREGPGQGLCLSLLMAHRPLLEVKLQTR